jgi:hypothetical protein
MNKKQKIIILIGILITVAMGLFPPWLHTVVLDGLPATGYYHWLFYKPPIDDIYWMRIDTWLLYLQWLIVTVAVAIMVYTAREK